MRLNRGKKSIKYSVFLQTLQVDDWVVADSYDADRFG